MAEEAERKKSDEARAGIVRLGGAVSILLACLLGYWIDPFGDPMLSAGVLGLVAGISFAMRPLFVRGPRA